MTLRKRLTGLKALRDGGSAPLPLTKRLKAWRHGFSGWTWLLYDLDTNDPRDYVPDRLSGRMAAIDGPVARSVLKNKLLFEKVVGQHVRVPKVYAAVERGGLTSLREDFTPRSVADMVRWVVDSETGVFVKPVDSSEGLGVISLEARDGRLLVDKRPSDVEAAIRLVASQNGSLVSELITQGPFGRSIFADSVNTMRVITMIDPDDHTPFIAAAIHRFGTKKSAPTDNVSRGGIRTAIDTRTGQMGVGMASWANENGEFLRFPVHPESGAAIEGVTVPHWQEVVDTLLGVVRQLPMLHYVGWDAVMGDDEVILIEGNHSPNIVQQVTSPYLADPRIRRFIESHGVLKGTGL